MGQNLTKTVVEIDQALLLWINSHHNKFLDLTMGWITERFFWIPFYILILILIILNKKKESILILIFVGVLILLSDQISSGFLKPFVGRLRPCHDSDIASFLHVPKGCGGKFGFVSSHATNSFALISFLVITFNLSFLVRTSLWFWAILISFSRVYLGVHYPGDIICGAILGLALGLLVSESYKYIKVKTFKL